MIAVRIAGVFLDDPAHSPVVLLQECDGERVLPILIGHAEAAAIALGLEHQQFARPLTLDLVKLMLDALNARVSRVIVTSLQNDTFHASLVVEREKEVFSFDARPSDSIGLAVRYKAPIFVADEVMDVAGQIPSEDEEGKLTQLQDWLRRTNPEELGDFKL